MAFHPKKKSWQPSAQDGIWSLGASLKKKIIPARPAEDYSNFTESDLCHVFRFPGFPSFVSRKAREEKENFKGTKETERVQRESA